MKAKHNITQLLEENEALHSRLHAINLVKVYESILAELKHPPSNQSAKITQQNEKILLKRKMDIESDFGVEIRQYRRMPQAEIEKEKKKLLDDIEKIRPFLREATGVIVHYDHVNDQKNKLIKEQHKLKQDILLLEKALKGKETLIADHMNKLAHELTKVGCLNGDEYYRNQVIPLIGEAQKIAELKRQEINKPQLNIFYLDKLTQREQRNHAAIAEAERVVNIERKLIPELIQSCQEVDGVLDGIKAKLSQLDDKLMNNQQEQSAIDGLIRTCKTLFNQTYAVTHALYKENVSRMKQGEPRLEKSDHDRYIASQRDLLGAMVTHLQSPTSATIETLIRRFDAYVDMKEKAKEQGNLVFTQELEKTLEAIVVANPLTTEKMGVILSGLKRSVFHDDNTAVSEEEKTSQDNLHR